MANLHRGKEGEVGITEPTEPMKRCVTHHYACDCREAKFAELERENTKLGNRLAVLLQTLADEGVVTHYTTPEFYHECQALVGPITATPRRS